MMIALVMKKINRRPTKNDGYTLNFGSGHLSVFNVYDVYWLFKKGIYFTLCYIIRIPIHPIFAHEYLNSNRHTHTHTDTESILDPLMNKWIEFILFEKNNESYHCKNIIKKNFGISEFHLYSIHVSIIVWLSSSVVLFINNKCAIAEYNNNRKIDEIFLRFSGCWNLSLTNFFFPQINTQCTLWAVITAFINLLNVSTNHRSTKGKQM